MDGVAQGSQHGFVGHFGHRGVSMDGSREVLEDRAHFQGERPFAHQFGNVGAHALDAQDAMVVFSGHDADESAGLFRFHGQGAAVRGQGELANDDRVSSGLGFVGGQAHADDLRIGEHDGWDANGVVSTVLAADDFGDHFSLEGGGVGQHLAHVGHVADGVDATHVCAAALVDLDEAALVERDPGRSEGRAVRLAADGHEDFVAGEAFGFGAVLGVLRAIEQAEPVLSFFDALGEDAGDDLDLRFLEGQFEGATEFLVENGQHAVHGFDDGHFAAQHPVRDSEFESDVAASDDHQMLGDVRQVQGAT